QFRVKITQLAEEQIRGQVIYIAQDSIDNALRWEDRLRQAIHEIGAMPGHAIDEDASARVGEPVRKFVFERTYLIHYTVNVDEAIVELIIFPPGTHLPRFDEP